MQFFNSFRNTYGKTLAEKRLDSVKGGKKITIQFRELSNVGQKGTNVFRQDGCNAVDGMYALIYEQKHFLQMCRVEEINVSYTK
jgi:hypothetical protein